MILPRDIKALGDKNDIETLVIACELSDHSFISELKRLRQLYIYTGDKINDLSFIEGLVELRELCLFDTHIASLEPLVKLAEEKSRLYNETEDIMRRIDYTFEGVCIMSDKPDIHPRDLMNKDTLRTTDLIINGKRSSHRERSKR